MREAELAARLRGIAEGRESQCGNTADGVMTEERSRCGEAAFILLRGSLSARNPGERILLPWKNLPFLP